MGYVKNEDLEYFAAQSAGNMNMIIAGMTHLMNSNDAKIEKMESQGWFKKMVFTVLGKNKATKEEIKANHDRLNAYMSEAMSELFKRGCIHEEMITSLGFQINEIYEDHVQLKSMLGAFACKLNEKIESIDNFHMLVTEIEQGVFDDFSQFNFIVKLLSMLDARTLEDDRKLAIIKRAIEQKNLLNEAPKSLEEHLLELLEIDDEHIGVVYLEMQNYKDHFIASVIINLIEEFYFVSGMQRKFLDKSKTILNVLESRGIDSTIILSAQEILDDFIQCKIDVNAGLVPIDDIQVDKKYEEALDLYLKCNFEEAFNIFNTIAQKGHARSMYILGEYYAQGYGNTQADKLIAKEWREKGADLGDVLAKLNIAYSIPQESPTRNEIFSETLPLIKELASNGDCFAQNELADMFLYGYGIEQNIDEAMNWLFKSADKGYWRSMYKLAGIYEDDKSGKKDLEKSVYWYRLAAEKGYGPAYFDYGYCYYNGLGIKQDYITAKEIFEEGAKKGNSGCSYYLGTMYAQGGQLTEDLQKSFELIMDAAKKGHKYAQRDLGHIYYFGRGVAIDNEEAAKWYKKSLEQGVVFCALKLAQIAESNGDDAEAILYYTKGAEGGIAKAQFELGQRYYYGRGVTCNETKAYEWFVKAAKQGDKEALEQISYRNIDIDNYRILPELTDMTLGKIQEKCHMFYTKYSSAYKRKNGNNNYMPCKEGKEASEAEMRDTGGCVSGLPDDVREGMKIYLYYCEGTGNKRCSFVVSNRGIHHIETGRRFSSYVPYGDMINTEISRYKNSIDALGIRFTPEEDGLGDYISMDDLYKMICEIKDIIIEESAII